jgi:hypothetical protein
VVKAADVDLIEIRDSVAPHRAIFVHACDFAQPSRKDVCGLGPSLKPSLDFRGWTDRISAAAIVKDVLLSLDKRARTVAIAAFVASRDLETVRRAILRRRAGNEGRVGTDVAGHHHAGCSGGRDLVL